MVIGNSLNCPVCNGSLKYYDRVHRIIRLGGGVRKRLTIRRLRCRDCGRTHRQLPKFLIPYKHYGSELIKGVLKGYITPETLGYEDYPCEATMSRWIYSLSQQFYF